MTVTVKRIGDWAAVRRLLEDVRDDAPKAVQSDMDKIAWAVKDYVINMIKGQKQHWAPLSDKWVDRKGHNMALVDTTEYLKNIDVFVDPRGKRKKTKGGRTKRKYIEWHVSPSGETIYNNPNYTYRDLAFWLEYGVASKNNPARPHWFVVHFYAKNIVRKLKRKYGRAKWPVPKMGVW